MVRHTARCSTRLLLALGLLSASAQGALPMRSMAQVSAPSDAQRARARELYGEGQRAFADGRFAVALTAFEGAYAEVPNPVVLLGVASAQEGLGHREDAARTLRRYLAERATAPDRASVEQRIAALDPSGATAAPAVTAPVVTAPAVTAPAVAAPAVTAPADVAHAAGEEASEGDVALPETAEGGATEGTASDAADEDVSSEDAGADAPAAAPTASDDGPSTVVWATTAVAGVGLVTGTVLGFLALSAQSDFDATPSTDTADRGEMFALTADLAFGVAIASGVSAIVLYATEGHGEAATSSAQSSGGVRFSMAPWAGPNGGGAGARLAF
jgi:hypothetical protein